MGDKLEKILIKFCENLITIYEKNGKCTKPNKICEYCEKMISKEYSCNKTTYLFDLEYSQIKR
jgi:hypothetical protein